MTHKLSSADWRRLTRSVRQGSCVLFLGPDAAFLNEKSESLASTLAKRFMEEEKKENSSDLHWAAQSFAIGGHDEFDLIDIAESFYKPHKGATTDFHRNLSALPFQLCVQTTPDQLMFNAFTEHPSKSPSKAYFHLRSGTHFYQKGALSTNIPEPTSAKPLVFGLNGSADDGLSVVLTENDVLEFLTRLVRDKSTLPAILLRRIQLATTCLFIGFGFHQWYQRLILYALRDSSASPKWRSLALESSRFFSHPDQLQTATYYDNEHRIDFSHLSFSEFASELKERYEAERSDKADAPQSITKHIPNAPKVFLSHTGCDAVAVEALSIELKNIGINTWQDTSDIRGGEDWEFKIKHVIREVVDYVVVLHSGNLRDQESWVEYEINIALERCKKMPPGFSFLIPCHFLKCRERRTRLQHLHYLIVDSPQDCDDLATAILHDWNINRQVEQVCD